MQLASPGNLSFSLEGNCFTEHPRQHLITKASITCTYWWGQAWALLYFPSSPTPSHSSDWSQLTNSTQPSPRRRLLTFFVAPIHTLLSLGDLPRFFHEAARFFLRFAGALGKNPARKFALRLVVCLHWKQEPALSLRTARLGLCEDRQLGCKETRVQKAVPLVRRGGLCSCATSCVRTVA